MNSAPAETASLAPDPPRLPRRHGRLLSLQCRRRLGDCEPHRAFGADVDVPVLDPGHRDRGLHQLGESGRRGGAHHHRSLAARRGVLTIGSIFAIYFASIGVESLRIGLNRAYGLIDPRPWWLLRLESIGYVLVAAVGLLALSFLVVLGPLVFRTALAYMPWLAEIESHFNIGRFVVATVLLVT